jgi:cob(I)alamin adenosyltransferase
MSPLETMQRLEALLTHVWMVRTFIKHSEEAEEDDELKEIQQALYNYMLALGTAWKDQDTDAYLRQAHKKLTRLVRATEQFAKIQPEVSSHMNYQMAVRSLQAAVGEISEILGESR